MKENSYSNHKKSHFDCGRTDLRKRRRRGASGVKIDVDNVLTIKSGTTGTGLDWARIICGNTIINDR